MIELDADMLSVYGPQSLRFLDRPWNRQRALKATTVQFNFVSFDDLVPYLPRFRQTFPNVENFEFIETDIRSLNQLNALALVQGITSLNVNPDGNPISVKGINVGCLRNLRWVMIMCGNVSGFERWRAYAIYRLEHWGLQFVNNTEITDEDILAANRTYGSLGELAIMVLPQSQIAPLIRKFDLSEYSSKDYVGSFWFEIENIFFFL